MRFFDVIKFLRILLQHRKMFLFWSIVLAISAVGPVLNVYLVTELINDVVEYQEITQTALSLLVGIFLVDFFDNTLRLLSKTRIAKICYSIQFETQVFLMKVISPKETSREKVIKAIENLTNSLSALLNYVKENGISALTKFVAIPIILFTINTKIFIIEILYILIYFLLDYLTTKQYQKKVDKVNEKLEDYFEGIIQDGRKPPKRSLILQISKREDFTFWEWNILQHLSRYFYLFVIIISIFEIVSGQAEIGALLLYTGYMVQTQGFLNILSVLFDRIADVSIGLKRVAQKGGVETSYIFNHIKK